MTFDPLYWAARAVGSVFGSGEERSRFGVDGNPAAEQKCEEIAVFVKCYCYSIGSGGGIIPWKKNRDYASPTSTVGDKATEVCGPFVRVLDEGNYQVKARNKLYTLSNKCKLNLVVVTNNLKEDVGQGGKSARDLGEKVRNWCVGHGGKIARDLGQKMRNWWGPV